MKRFVYSLALLMLFAAALRAQVIDFYGAQQSSGSVIPEGANMLTPGIVRLIHGSTITEYGGAATTDVLRGTAVASAVTAAASDDMVTIGAVTCDLGSGVTTIAAAGLTLTGAGYASTTIKSTADVNSVGGIVQIGADNVTISNLRIYGSKTDGTYQSPVTGKKDPTHNDSGGYGEFGFTNLNLHTVKLEAGTDGFRIYGLSGANFSGTFTNCVFRTQWDAVASYNFNHEDDSMGTVAFTLTGCDMQTTGGNPASVSDSHCLTIEQGIFGVYSSTLQSTSGDNGCVTVRTIDDSDSGLPSGRVDIYGNTISSGSAGLDLSGQGDPGIFVHAGNSYDHAKTSGLITILDSGWKWWFAFPQRRSGFND